MARIRSIHPRIYTDENFVSLSMAARVLLPALWTEAFDDGVFEWKPLTLKMRLFPADPLDLGKLLEELEAASWLRRFDAAGKAYGAIRNFQKWQRPKKPNSSGVLPTDLVAYVGADPAMSADSAPPGGRSVHDTEQVGNQFGTSSEPVENQFGTGGESASQKGGREEGRKENIPPSAGEPPASPPDRLDREPVADRRSPVPASPAPPPSPQALAMAQIVAETIAAKKAEWQTPKCRLWREGLAQIKAMTGKSDRAARPLIGRMIDHLRHAPGVVDPEGELLAVIERAAADPPSEPVAWIEAAIRNRATPSADAAPSAISPGDPPEAWEGVADSFEVDRVTGRRHPICGLSRADVVLEKVIEAAGMRWDWRGDVGPLARWLRQIGQDADIIVPKAVRDRAAWRGYEPPASLAFFEKTVMGPRLAVAS